MKYMGKRDRIKEYIQNVCILKLKNLRFDEGLNYSSVVDELTLETGANPKLIQEVIDTFIKTRRLKEERFIYLGDYIKSQMEKEKEEREKLADEEVNKLLGFNNG